MGHIGEYYGVIQADPRSLDCSSHGRPKGALQSHCLFQRAPHVLLCKFADRVGCHGVPE